MFIIIIFKTSRNQLKKVILQALQSFKAILKFILANQKSFLSLLLVKQSSPKVNEYSMIEYLKQKWEKHEIPSKVIQGY